MGRHARAKPTLAARLLRLLLEQPGQFDLLHVACHGATDAADIGSARLEMPGKPRSDGTLSEEDVLATTVRHEAELRAEGGQPMVVLNACQSARAGASRPSLAAPTRLLHSSNRVPSQNSTTRSVSRPPHVTAYSGTRLAASRSSCAAACALRSAIAARAARRKRRRRSLRSRRRGTASLNRTPST